MLTPATEAEVAEVVAGAEAGAAGPLVVQGGGTRGVAPDAGAGAVLSVARLSGITLYEPGALTLVVQAGTPVAVVEEALAAEGQRLAFEPMDHRALLGTGGDPTIGGIVAANVSGPRRVVAGACRDFMLGVRFVDGAGTVIKNGGRVMKNVTGYDLVKLLTGSYGTLGVLTEVSLKVLPKPESEATLVYPGAGRAASAALFAAALGTPYEVSGAARLPAGVLGEDGAVVLRLEGFADSVSYRQGALARVLEPIAGAPGRVITEPHDSAKIWAQVRDVAPFADRPGDVWRLSVKPTDCAALGGVLGQEDCLMDWGGGLIWACVSEGTDMRAKLGGLAGHATRVRGKGPGAFHPQNPVAAWLSAGLKAKFDPRGILNPGVLV